MTIIIIITVTTITITASTAFCNMYAVVNNRKGLTPVD
jgi:hypothetical protein